MPELMTAHDLSDESVVTVQLWEQQQAAAIPTSGGPPPDDTGPNTCNGPQSPDGDSDNLLLTNATFPTPPTWGRCRRRKTIPARRWAMRIAGSRASSRKGSFLFGARGTRW